MSALTQLRAGDSAGWTETLPDHPPAAGWALHYRLLWPSAAAVDIAAVAGADDYTVTIPPATTATLPAGIATLVWWVERGADETLERVSLGCQPLSILPNLTTATTYDARTLNAIALAEAKAALAAHVASGRAHVGEYSIAGRSMKFRTADEITALIQYYERECAKERALLASLQGHAPGRILTRF
ncbi:MAG: hypothetical protein Q7J47_03310 [Azoarcus sp.]|nr:hypothetical protein [Azoarcus sp.]